MSKDIKMSEIGQKEKLPMTPVQIEVLVNCYYRCDVDENISQSFREAVCNFLAKGVIEEHPLPECTYRTTKKGDAWVQVLCKVQCPEEKTFYVDTNGNVIE